MSIIKYCRCGNEVSVQHEDDDPMCSQCHNRWRTVQKRNETRNKPKPKDEKPPLERL